MVVNAKKLVKLPVCTRSGIDVGKVSGVEIETDTGRIATLLVKPRTPIVGKELRVAWAQIVSFTDKEIIVDDAVVPAPVPGMVLEGADI